MSFPRGPSLRRGARLGSRPIQGSDRPLRVIQGSFNAIYNKFERRFMEASRVFKESVKCVLKNFKKKF